MEFVWDIRLESYDVERQNLNTTKPDFFHKQQKTFTFNL